ncbi:MAG TPA: MerR family transcriptional regulator [Candidatus Nanoarchaeia archaeon]|nr:hypothetical protein [uncultured archaeon]
MENNENKPLFTLSVTAEIIGVHPRTLMIYENEDLVIPHRTKTNRRRYSQKDIARLQFIRYLTNRKGINLAGVSTILALLEIAGKKDLDLKKISFSDFPEQKMF